MSRNKVNQHLFTEKILAILKVQFGDVSDEVYSASPLLRYINKKTKAANLGSKSRASFANHYALYVIIEDYISKGFFSKSAGIAYEKYQGARFSDLLKRQRELPFGRKLQNHALNARLNDEFKKFYPDIGKLPIVRDVESQRYWIHEDLLLVRVRDKNGQNRTHNIAKAIILIIDEYVATKKSAFDDFLETCRKISNIEKTNPEQAFKFIIEQLQPSVDARLFEIVSYAVLKSKYRLETVWIGLAKETIEEESLVLYKTGRTNANDGGIDFVMKPLGRFFQVTETMDVTKYFLDIDKVQRFPITFVVKSNASVSEIKSAIRAQAVEKYKIETVVETYMNAVEEVINVPELVESFKAVVKSDRLREVMEEIVNQSKVEFNYTNDDNVDDDGDDDLPMDSG